MNPEKRRLFKAIKLKLALKDILPYIWPKLPPNELIYEIEYVHATHGSKDTAAFNPPLLPSDLETHVGHQVSERCELVVSGEPIIVKTRTVIPLEDGFTCKDSAYPFTVVDLIDP